MKGLGINMIDESNIMDYLNGAKKHYNYLSIHMARDKDKERYSHEHYGKMKFIELLIFMIENGAFDNKMDSDKHEE